jgi:hypothetical protein
MLQREEPWISREQFCLTACRHKTIGGLDVSMNDSSGLRGRPECLQSKQKKA